MNELLTLGLSLLLAKVGEGLAKLLGLPSLIGPLLVGLALSKVLDLHGIAPLAALGGLLLVFFAGAEEVSKVEMGRKEALVGLLSLFVPAAVGTLLVGSVLAALIAALPGVGILAKLIKENPTMEVSDLLVSLAFAEALGILLYSGLKGGAIEVLIGLLVAALSLKLGEKALKALMVLEDYSHGPEVVAGTFLALLLLFMLLPEKFGFSAVVMALAFGILLSDYLDERPWVKKRLKAINDTFLEPLFFLYVAAGLKHLDPLASLPALVVLASKALTLFVLTKDRKKSLLGLAKGGADSALLLSASLDPRPYSFVFFTIILGALIPSLSFKQKRMPLRLCDLPLDPTHVDVHDPVEKAKEVLGPERPAVVVTKDERPVGWISLLEIMAASEDVSVDEVMNEGVPTFDCKAPLWKVLSVRGELGSPVVAVVEGSTFKGSLHLGHVKGLAGSASSEARVVARRESGEEANSETANEEERN